MVVPFKIRSHKPNYQFFKKYLGVSRISLYEACLNEHIIFLAQAEPFDVAEVNINTDANAVTVNVNVRR